MIIIGANEGQTNTGKKLRDGGAAIILDGTLCFASGEERHSRVKASGGYALALAEGLRSIGGNDVDMLYLSSCCEPVRSQTDCRKYVDHHLSHAALSFYTSGFDQALVIVADDGGNVLQDIATKNWWQYPRQQLSIYVGRGGELTKVDQEFSAPLACGLGEFYRAFTYFLGWPSGRHAGKVMALSGLMLDDKLSTRDFFSINGKLGIRSNNGYFDPFQPKKTAESFLASVGRTDLILKVTAEDFDAKVEVAALVQRCLEEHLVALSSKWMRQLDVVNVCLSGGVALNCTAAHKIRSQTGANVYVPPGAGDSGQSVGNAILGYISNTRKVPNIPELAFLGSKKIISRSTLLAETSRLRAPVSIIELPPDHMNRFVANALFKGEIVFWYQGKGEFGARALGNRSILASPQHSGIIEKLNNLKKRELFNPFAASCIFEDKDKFFEDATNSPYMTMAFKVKSHMKHEIPGVVHQDGTCRAQIFKRDFNCSYYDLISAFKRLSGLGVLLNTSLNGAGEPIIEEPRDVIELLVKSETVRIAVIDNYIAIVENRKGPVPLENSLKNLRNIHI